MVESAIPCSVRVIDCSSFSSSSVKVSCLDIEDPGRDIICRFLGLTGCGLGDAVVVGSAKVACCRSRRVQCGDAINIVTSLPTVHTCTLQVPAYCNSPLHHFLHLSTIK